MNRNKMVTALCVALVVSGLFTAFIARQLNSKKHVVTDQLYIGLNKPVMAGTVIKAEDIKQIVWPSNVPLTGAFTKTQDVVGRTALESLPQDAPVLNQNLAAPGSGVGLSVKIPDGMRAISLKSDEVVGVSGFLFPGSHVDVLVTYRTPTSPDPITATVLQDVQVLAAGNKTVPDPSGVAANVNEVTLLLNPQDAAKAVLASTQGSIHFVLRNGSDDVQEKDTAVEMSMLSGAAPPKGAIEHVTKVPMAPIHIKKPTLDVETVSGDKTMTSSF